MLCFSISLVKVKEILYLTFAMWLSIGSDIQGFSNNQNQFFFIFHK